MRCACGFILTFLLVLHPSLAMGEGFFQSLQKTKQNNEEYPTPSQFRQHYQYYRGFYERAGQPAPNPDQYDYQYSQYMSQLKQWEMQKKAQKALVQAGAWGGDDARATASLDSFATGRRSGAARYTQQLAVSTSLASTEDSTDFALGFLFNHRFTSWGGLFGFNLMAEFTQSTPPRKMFLAGISMFPLWGFHFRASAGISDNPSSLDPALRLGGSYDFDMGDFIFSPLLYSDFTGGVILFVAGASLGIMF